MSTAVSKILAAKALAAVVLLAGATGGVALAANSTTATRPGPHAITSTPFDDTRTASTSDDVEPLKPTNSKKPDNAKTPDPSLQGLCRSFTAGGLKADKDHLPPAFDALIAAAGSAADVEKFCADQPAPGKSADAPGQAAKTAEPTKPTGSSDTDDTEKVKATKKAEVAAKDGDDEDDDSDDAKKGRSDNKPSPAQRSGQPADR